MQPVTIPEAQPFYFERGPVGALLLHGFTSTPYEVRELGERLAQAGITVLGPVLPGHGTTPTDLARTSWHDWNVAVEAGITQLESAVEEIFVIGISAGAALALHAAAHRPGLQGVVGLSTILQIHGVHPRLLRWMARVLPALPKRGKASIRDPVARARHPAYDCLPLRGVASLADLLNHLQDDLPAVQVPVLLVHARHDSVARPADVDQILKRLGSRQKSVVWVENSDHIITEDYEKEAVFVHVIQFVRDHSRRLDPSPSPLEGGK